VRSACLIAFGFGAFVAAALSTSCKQGPAYTSHRSFTSTVTFSTENTLAVDSDLSLTMEGAAGQHDITAAIDATVTASTSTRAAQYASNLALTVDRSKAGTVHLVLAAPKGAEGMSGSMDVHVPVGLDVQVIEHTGTVVVDHVAGAISVVAASGVRVVDATQNVNVAVSSGNAIVDTRLSGSSVVSVDVDSGDIELDIPNGFDADIQATVVSSGTIVPNHPRLPPFFGMVGDTYHVVLGQGIASVRLQTNVGRILIQERM
jgi:hypothetical protein